MLSTAKLSQHAVGQSEASEVRHAIPAYTVQPHYPNMHCESKLYKRGCKSPEHWTSYHNKTAVQLEEPEQEEQAAMTP